MERIILFIFLSLLLSSCLTEQPELSSFEVSVDSHTYQVGDVVKFYLHGNPDIISFYSGETGSTYSYAKKDRIVEAIANVSFQTQNRSLSYKGTPDNGSAFCQENQFRVKVSTDFNGQYDSLSVKVATWSDITDNFAIGPVSCSSTSLYAPAGDRNLNDYLEDDKPFYFAFQYVNLPNSEYGNANIWRFSNFDLKAISDVGSVAIATQVSASWSPVFIGQEWDLTKGFSTSTTNITLRADPNYRNIYQELWCISKALNFDKEINVGTDKAIGIKSIADVPLTSYMHVYTEPGTYIVTFLAANTSIYERKEIVKHVEINVLP